MIEKCGKVIAEPKKLIESRSAKKQ